MQAIEQKRDYSSREVKFRAWDKRAKKWRAVNTLCLYDSKTGKAGLNGAIVADGKSKQGTFMPIEGLEVVQYTGRHSIDGVEVYAGDLLQFPGLNETYEVLWNNLKDGWCLFFRGGLTRAGNGT